MKNINISKELSIIYQKIKRNWYKPAPISDVILHIVNDQQMITPVRLIYVLYQVTEAFKLPIDWSKFYKNPSELLNHVDDSGSPIIQIVPLDNNKFKLETTKKPVINLSKRQTNLLNRHLKRIKHQNDIHLMNQLKFL